MSVLRMLSVCALSCVAAACVAVQSRSAQNGGEGFAYLAPLRELTVTAVRTAAINAPTQLRIDRARTNLLAAGPVTSAATQAVEAAIAQVASARLALASAADAQRAEAERLLARRESELSVARDALARATAREIALEEHYATLLEDAAADASQWQESVRVTQGAAIGDTRARFAANLNHAVFRSDRATVRIGSNSLLQSVNLTSEGQLDETIIALAESVVALRSNASQLESVAGPAPSCDETGNLTSEFENDQVGPANYTFTIEPTNQSDIDRVNSSLCQLGFSYRIEVPANAAGPQQRATSPVSAPAPCPQRNGVYLCDGLVYRQNEPLRVNVRRIDTKAEEDAPRQRGMIADSATFNLPNTSPIYVIPYGSAYAVTQRTDITLSDGSLTVADLDHQSEGAALARLPFRALDAATQSLSQLVQFRINLTRREGELEVAQRELEALQAQRGATEIERLEALQRVLELQADIAELRSRIRAAEAQDPE